MWIQCKLWDVLWGAVLCEVGWDFKATTPKLSPKTETSLYLVSLCIQFSKCLVNVCRMNEQMHGWVDGWLCYVEHFLLAAPREGSSNLCFTSMDWRSCWSAVCWWNRKCPGAQEGLDCTQLDFGVYSRGWLVPRGWPRRESVCSASFISSCPLLGLRMAFLSGHHCLWWNRR